MAPPAELVLDRSGTDKIVGRAIRDLLATPGPVAAAVAYVTGDPTTLLALSRARGCDLRVVCEPYMGNCDPQALDALEATGATVYCAKALHAKVYVSDAGVAVGSPNLSAGALDAGTLEALTVLRGPEHIAGARAWFDALVRAATPWQAIKRDPIAYRRICLAYAAKRGRGEGSRVVRRTLTTAFAEPVALGEHLVVNLVAVGEKPAPRAAAKAAAAASGHRLPAGWSHDSVPDPSRNDAAAARAVEPGTAVLTLHVETPDTSDGVVAFVEVDPELALWAGASVVDGVLFGYYAPVDADDRMVRNLRLDLTAGSRREFINALNAGLKARPKVARRLRTSRFAAPAQLAALLK